MDTGPKTPPPPRRRAKFSENLLDNRAILSALGIKPGQWVMDAGCGTGYMAKLFAARAGPGRRVWALDLDRQFVRELSEDPDAGGLEIIQADITKPTGLDRGSLDLIYLSTVWHTFNQEKRAGFIKESGRLLKPGGLLAIVEIEKKPTPFGPPLEQRSSPQDLMAAISFEPAGTHKVSRHFYMQLFLR